MPIWCIAHPHLAQQEQPRSTQVFYGRFSRVRALGAQCLVFRRMLSAKTDDLAESSKVLLAVSNSVVQSDMG